MTPERSGNKIRTSQATSTSAFAHNALTGVVSAVLEQPGDDNGYASAAIFARNAASWEAASMPTPSARIAACCCCCCSVLAFGLGCPVMVAAAMLMSAVAAVFCDSAVLGAAGMLSSTPTACSASGFSAVLLLPAAFGTGSRDAGCCVLSMVAAGMLPASGMRSLDAAAVSGVILAEGGCSASRLSGFSSLSLFAPEAKTSSDSGTGDGLGEEQTMTGEGGLLGLLGIPERERRGGVLGCSCLTSCCAATCVACWVCTTGTCWDLSPALGEGLFASWLGGCAVCEAGSCWSWRWVVSVSLSMAFAERRPPWWGCCTGWPASWWSCCTAWVSWV